MAAVVPEQDHRMMIPHAYLSDLNKIAMYALAMGAPLGLVRHVTFLLNYINAWLDQVKGDAEEAEKAARAVFDRAPARLVPCASLGTAGAEAPGQIRSQRWQLSTSRS